jgi:hypothetical protein
MDKAKYDAVNSRLFEGGQAWPDGILTHAAGETGDGGLIVFEIWESKEKQAAFMESRLEPAFGEVGVPQPSKVTWIDICGHETPG